VPFAQKFPPPIPSLSSADVQDYKDGQLKWIIENGINPSGMPSWKGILSDEGDVDNCKFYPPPATQRKSGDSGRLCRGTGRAPAHAPQRPKINTLSLLSF
jgi:hypothetical protein